MAAALAGDAREARATELDALARRLWADALVFDPCQLAAPAAVFGFDHLLLGSDFPFVGFPEATDAAFAADPALRADNVRRFLFGDTATEREGTCATPMS
jgi:predicted TIM-barrel fold metal-dependent hydrolase